MLIFRVKEVLVQRETRNALLLLLAEIFANVFLVSFAFGTNRLTDPLFLSILAGNVLLLAGAFFLSGKRPLSALLLGGLLAFAFSPLFFCWTNDWRSWLLGLAPAIYCGFLVFRVAFNFYRANVDAEAAVLNEKRWLKPVFGPRTMLFMPLNWLALFALSLLLYRADVLGWPAFVASSVLAFWALYGSFRSEIHLYKRSKGKFCFFILTAFILTVAAFAFGEWSLGLLGVMAVLCFVLAHYFARSAAFDRFSNYFFQHPALLLVVSFLGVILTGTYLLALPWVLNKGCDIGLVDALFMSASATCVTGLATVDISKVFSFSGQVVILGLIQVGGLGIMTLSTFSALVLGRAIGLRQEYFVKDMLGEKRQSNVLPLTIFICTATFIIEAVGVAFLFPQMLHMGLGWKVSLWKSVFHSVSAFCNGGLSLQTDSLMMFQHHPWILLTFTALIVAGGLGFGVLSWISDFVRFKKPHSNFYVSVVIVGTLILVFGGMIGFLLWDHSRGLSNFDWPEKICNALFCSVTARTAGFSTFDLNDMSRAGRFLTMVLMFVGGAPGSTAGGVKLTTLVIFLALLFAVLRGRDDVTLGRHSFNANTVWRAVTVFMLYNVTFLTGFILLITFENGGYEEILFEAVSAIGTTGLSMGITEKLSVMGKLVITAMMFIGRIGPLTLLLLLPTRKRSAIEYPKTPLMVG